MARLKNKENDILAAANEVFLSNGFSKANMQDIADKAGIGKGTIYEYFKSKDDLFVQAFKYDIQSFSVQINEEILKEESFFNKLTKHIESTENFFLERGGRINYYITRGSAELNPKAQLDLEQFVKNMKNSGKSLMYHILKQGIDEGHINNIDMDFAAEVVGGVVPFHCYRICYENDYSKEQRREENVKLINFIMNGIGTKKN